jgi:hypothetical protein
MCAEASTVLRDVMRPIITVNVLLWLPRLPGAGGERQ